MPVSSPRASGFLPPPIQIYSWSSKLCSEPFSFLKSSLIPTIFEWLQNFSLYITHTDVVCVFVLFANFLGLPQATSWIAFVFFTINRMLYKQSMLHECTRNIQMHASHTRIISVTMSREILHVTESKFLSDPRISSTVSRHRALSGR